MDGSGVFGMPGSLPLGKRQNLDEYIVTAKPAYEAFAQEVADSQGTTLMRRFEGTRLDCLGKNSVSLWLQQFVLESSLDVETVQGLGDKRFVPLGFQPAQVMPTKHGTVLLWRDIENGGRIVADIANVSFIYGDSDERPESNAYSYEHCTLPAEHTAWEKTLPIDPSSKAIAISDGRLQSGE